MSARRSEDEKVDCGSYVRRLISCLRTGGRGAYLLVPKSLLRAAPKRRPYCV